MSRCIGCEWGMLPCVGLATVGPRAWPGSGLRVAWWATGGQLPLSATPRLLGLPVTSVNPLRATLSAYRVLLHT